MKRNDGREPGQLRTIHLTPDYQTHPLASVLTEFGGTKVACAVTMENGVPPWMRAQNVPGGWITSEYAMLPSSTHSRTQREAVKGKQGGRTMEIQRLIGRSIRAVVDLSLIGSNTFYIDCDVIDADGGTRCASITGAAVAMRLACNRLLAEKRISRDPMRELVAAVSVGMAKGTPLLDLCYQEDSTADVDMNIIMTESGKFVEIQGCAEETPFSYEEMESMLALARDGIKTIFSLQHDCLAPPKESAKSGNRKSSGKKRFGSIGDLFEGIAIENGPGNTGNSKESGPENRETPSSQGQV